MTGEKTKPKGPKTFAYANDNRGGDTVDDKKIIELYFKRDESAIKETSNKYGRLCYYIANNILSCPEDSEECVNDTYSRAWNSIPPAKPEKLGAYLAKITRNLALDKYNEQNADKRRAQSDSLSLEELEAILSDGGTSPEDEIVMKECINSFLYSLDKEKRIVFVQRYFYMSSIEDIAKNNALKETNVKVILLRLRQKFKKHLKDYGYEEE